MSSDYSTPDSHASAPDPLASEWVKAEVSASDQLESQPPAEPRSEPVDDRPDSPDAAQPSTPPLEDANAAAPTADDEMTAEPDSPSVEYEPGANAWEKLAVEAPQSETLELMSEPVPPEALPEPFAEPEPEAAPGEQPEPLAPVGPPAVSLNLEALTEALLFVADEPVPVARLAEALEVKPAEVEAVLERLGLAYAERGLNLQRIRDRVQLTTAPAAADKVQRFLGLAASAPLSKAALETLAIIAYQQPITRPQIEAVRGVNSDSVIKNLLTKGLVEETGRTEGPGRPVLYATTPEFLQHFGLNALTDLPPLNLEGLPPVQPLEILKG